MAKQIPEAEAAYAKALRRIEECREVGEHELNLSSLNLTTLPPEIGQLKALTELYLSNNHRPCRKPRGFGLEESRGGNRTTLPAARAEQLVELFGFRHGKSSTA